MRYLFTLLFSIFFLPVFSQVFPVNLFLSGTGRYPLKLSELVNSVPSSFTLTLTVSDITILNMPIKFVMTITNGNKKFTTILQNIQPLNISGGETKILPVSDLSQYFNQNNINFNGYNYRQAGQLPEGSNKLQIYAVNALTGIRVSNVASLNMFATLAAAPKLKFPENNAAYENPNANPVITFQWKQPSFSYATVTKYKFQLFEIQTENVSLQTVAESTIPFLIPTL